MISIIMIVYKVEQYVEESIKSVLNQTYKDIELIIVASDGGDRSVEICRQYAAKDQRIKLIETPPRGEPDARNHGLAAVTGDYLGFVDSDDHVESEMFERMLKNMQEYDADIAVCGRFFEYMNTEVADKAKDPVVLTPEEALYITLGHDGFFLHCWDKLYSRKIFEGLTFDPEMLVEDRIVVDKLLSKADRIVYDPTPMYHFRQRYGSGSKRVGIVRMNMDSNCLMEKFIRSEYPSLSGRCDEFMLYECVTAVQNELVSETSNRDDIALYRKMIKDYLGRKDTVYSRSLRIKSFMALFAPWILKEYTKRRQKSVAQQLERYP